MKRLNILLLLIISLIFTTSCEKVIEFNEKETEPFVVFSSLANPDTTLMVQVTKSVFFLSNKDPQSGYYHKDTKVKATVNKTQILELKHLNEELVGQYTASYQPKPGDEIEVTVNIPGLKEAKAVTKVPSKANFVVNSIKEIAKKMDNEIRNFYAIDMTIHDDGSIKDFYYLKVKGIVIYTNPSTNEDFYIIEERRLYSDDIIFKNSAINSLLGSDKLTPFFSDGLINGKSHQFIIEVEKRERRANEQFFFEVELKSLSEDYYKYIISLESYKATIGFGSMFSEKVQIHSNVQNGIGIFGGVNQHKIRTKVY